MLRQKIALGLAVVIPFVIVAVIYCMGWVVPHVDWVSTCEENARMLRRYPPEYPFLSHGGFRFYRVDGHHFEPGPQSVALDTRIHWSAATRVWFGMLLDDVLHVEHGTKTDSTPFVDGGRLFDAPDIVYDGYLVDRDLSGGYTTLEQRPLFRLLWSEYNDVVASLQDSAGAQAPVLARRLVAAMIQSITFYDWARVALGTFRPPCYTPSLDARGTCEWWAMSQELLTGDTSAWSICPQTEFTVPARGTVARDHFFRHLTMDSLRHARDADPFFVQWDPTLQTESGVDLLWIRSQRLHTLCARHISEDFCVHASSFE